MEFQIIKNQKYASDIVDALIEKAGFPLEDAVSLVSKIPNAPTIEAEPVRHGKWEYECYKTIWYGAGDPPEYKCSVCDDLAYNTHDYCPNCGAKMDLEEGSDKCVT